VVRIKLRGIARLKYFFNSIFHHFAERTGIAGRGVSAYFAEFVGYKNIVFRFFYYR
jgi:hypothetical protein